jgi:hypothetical protein
VKPTVLLLICHLPAPTQPSVKLISVTGYLSYDVTWIAVSSSISATSNVMPCHYQHDVTHKLVHTDTEI